MKSFIVLFIALFTAIASDFAQVGISPDHSQPDRSAMLDIKSSSKGLLVPRLSLAEIQTITNPSNSLLVFCTSDNTFYAYLAGSSEWKQVLFGGGTITPTCGIPFIDSRDLQSYSTVQIGTQCWMAENLNTGNRINGAQSQANNGIIEKYCYSNLDTNCVIYGGLYQWNEMMQYTTSSGTQGICPSGWHLPADAELMILVTFLGGIDVAGGKMKEADTVHWLSPNSGATDEAGFTALPASFRDYMGMFSTPLGERTSYWTSTQNGSTYGWDYSLYYHTDDISRNSGAMKSNGFSVRCLKD